MLRRCLLAGLLAALSLPALVAIAQEKPPGEPSPAPAATPTPAPSPTPKPQPPPTAKDRKRGAALIAKAVEAFGGASAVDAVKSLRLKGKGSRLLANGTEMQVLTDARIVFPDRYRQETTLPGGTMATLLSPQGAFVAIGEAALPLPEEEMASLRKTVRRNLVSLLQARRDPSYAAGFVEAGTVGGTPVERVRVEIGGEPTTLGIDPRTGRILEMSYTATGLTGAPGRFVVGYSDYRRIDGLSYPFAASGTFDGKPGFASTIESVAVNGSFDEGIFLPPPPPSPEPAAAAEPPKEEKKPSPPPGTP